MSVRSGLARVGESMSSVSRVSTCSAMVSDHLVIFSCSAFRRFDSWVATESFGLLPTRSIHASSPMRSSAIFRPDAAVSSSFHGLRAAWIDKLSASLSVSCGARFPASEIRIEVDSSTSTTTFRRVVSFHTDAITGWSSMSITRPSSASLNPTSSIPVLRGTIRRSSSYNHSSTSATATPTSAIDQIGQFVASRNIRPSRLKISQTPPNARAIRRAAVVTP